jgi:hypothetical protein
METRDQLLQKIKHMKDKRCVGASRLRKAQLIELHSVMQRNGDVSQFRHTKKSRAPRKSPAKSKSPRKSPLKQPKSPQQPKSPRKSPKSPKSPMSPMSPMSPHKLAKSPKSAGLRHLVAANKWDKAKPKIKDGEKFTAGPNKNLYQLQGKKTINLDLNPEMEK